MKIRERMEEWGGLLFRERGVVPVPFFLLLFFLSWGEYENNFVIWSWGIFFLLCGALLRGWAAKHIGKYSRTRKRQCKRVVMSGPYALTRNPLYVGNLFIIVAFTLMSELVWILPIIIPLFIFYYTCIIYWEENILKETFAEEAAEYFVRVPRWWSIKGLGKRIGEAISTAGDSPLGEVMYRERRTWQFLVVMTLLFLVKEVWNNHHHSIWIPFLYN